MKKKTAAVAKGINVFLRNARVEAGLSQSDVSEHLGLSSSQYISNIERGLCPPSVETLVKMTKLYRLPQKKVVTILVTDFEKSLKGKFVGGPSATKSRKN